MKLRVLVACEFSGIVREAFRKRGHDAWSCDLLPTEIPGQHIQDDVLKHINDRWDLIIVHPPCTYLCNSGVRWLYYNTKGYTYNVERWQKMRLASEFFKIFLSLKVPKICIENPINHKFADLPKYSQIIQPWQFGHGETKATCLWLRGLPKLIPTNIVDGRNPRVHYEAPSQNRWKNRSRTFQGIANAMADQWGN